MMSSQSPSILLGQRLKTVSEDFAGSDLQQMVSRLLTILRYRRWSFILPMLTGMTVVLAVSLLVPRQYVMRTIFERREDPILLKLVANSPLNLEIHRQTLRFNVISPAAVGQALEQAGFDGTGLSPEAAAARKRALVGHLASNLQVMVINSGPNHDLIELKYTGDQPDVAHAVIPILRDNYVRNSKAAIRNLQHQAREFFARETEKRRAEVARLQAELTQALVNQPEMAPGRPEWLHERLRAEDLTLEQLNRARHEMQTEIEAREEYLRQLDEQQARGDTLPSPALVTRVVESPQHKALQTQIEKIEAEIADAKTVRQMKDTHPHVMALNRKLERLRTDLERLGQEIVTGSDGTETAQNPWDRERNRIGMELKTFRGKLAQLDRDLAAHQAAKKELEGQKATLFDRQQKHMLQEQALEASRAGLGVWQAKLEEINRMLAAEDLDRGVRFNTIEECQRPVRPTSPNLNVMLILSAAVGLALAVVVVFLREIFDRSVRSPARVNRLLGIPVLETIEDILVRPSPKRWFTAYVLPVVAIVQIGVVGGLGWLLYLSLQEPERYARWVGGLAAMVF
ncbi:MAG TPA: hypothetical protein PK458_18535 [Phycisphaerae bacterium]|nr:hypothetical protein [Phycisphaerae bacterium]